MYDIENGSSTVHDREWHSLRRVPALQRQRCGLVVVDGTLHVIGGRCWFLEFVFTGVYRVNSNEWKQLQSFVQPFQPSVSVAIGPQTFSFICTMQDTSFGRFYITTGRWKGLPALPRCRLCFSAAAVGHDVFVMGGRFLNEGGPLEPVPLTFDT